MSKRILLDSGPLGRLAHPLATPQALDWLNRMDAAGAIIVIPEIADYEVRRSLVRHKLQASIDRLDELGKALEYLPLTTNSMRKAAELWALMRNQGKPTAGDLELDGDVILAAQALEVSGLVATENVRHISRMVSAKAWLGITQSDL